MSFLIYFFVLLVAAGSVLFGLDWQQAPLPPLPTSPHVVQAASAPAPSATKALPPAAAAKQDANKLDAKLSPVYPASPAVTLQDASDASAAKAELAPSAQAVDAATGAKCDVDACAAAYHSFRAADCTYQPYDGPRRLCEKGTPPEPDRTTAQASEARAQATCNVAACERAYRSFVASDCTYQPTNGPRRICMK